ncbi:hypothetical protein [Streptomyces europaeiscabiei]|uniref:hypothetical protein n=1 Tax=Streptomyces europaeiscabiei TaxID=146819 RepID=UPI000AD7D2F9|nr:hypothetical protein [Streptomyces europaeiscabiei]
MSEGDVGWVLRRPRVRWGLVAQFPAPLKNTGPAGLKNTGPAGLKSTGPAGLKGSGLCGSEQPVLRA